MAEKVFKMTAEGKAQLEAELDSLKTEGRRDYRRHREGQCEHGLQGHRAAQVRRCARDL